MKNLQRKGSDNVLFQDRTFFLITSPIFIGMQCKFGILGIIIFMGREK